MKKRISLLMAVLMILSLIFTAVSCSKAGQQKSERENATSVPSTVPITDESAATAAPSDNEESTSAQTTVPVSSETTTKAEADEPPATDTISPLIWRVTDKDGHTLYLFGTIHVGDNRNDTVFERISPVLESCDALAVEFDVVSYASNAGQMMKDMQQYILTDGSTVSDYMPADLYSRSCELLQKAGLFPSLFKRYNLAMWSQMVETALLTVYSDLAAEKAMDSIIIKHAKAKKMPVLEVESSEFQMSLLNSFDNELYLILIEEALDSADTYKEDLNKLYEYWLSGNKNLLWTYLKNEDEDYEDAENYTEKQIALIKDYNRKLLDDRNIGMRDKAIEYLKSGQTVFFAVGSAHMANETGLVRLLSDAGYKVEMISY